MVAIRQATQEDATDLLPLLEEFFLQTKHHIDHGVPWIIEDTSDVLEGLIDNPDVVVLLAEEEGKLLGATAAIKTHLWLAPSSTVGIELFWYVYPEHRKSKAAKQLFNALENWAKEINCDAFTMVALDHLEVERVAKIYKFKGYEPCERSFIKRL